MQQIKKILCATDLSQTSGRLLSLGVDLCLKFGASFLVFHAVPPPRGSVARQIEFERGGEKQKLISQAQRKMEQTMARFDIKWDLYITYGDPALEVARIAKKAKPDIVMAASHGLSVFQQFLIGSVIGAMAENMLQPFLVIPPAKTSFDKTDPKLEFTHIIIACSLTESDARLKDYALAFSEQFNSKINLIHVMESPVNEKVMSSTLGHYDETQRLLEEKLKKRLNDLMPGKPHILHGVPGEALAIFAKNHGIELIIAGIDDHPGRIIATTTATLLRQMPCPVITIPIKR